MIIKDVFVLKKESYHCKMMNYIWGFKPTDFSHMCPYFWLTIANHIIILFVFPIKSLVKGVSWLGDKVDTLAREKRYEKRQVKEMKYETKVKQYTQRALTDENFFEEIAKSMAAHKVGAKYCFPESYFEVRDKVFYRSDSSEDAMEKFNAMMAKWEAHFRELRIEERKRQAELEELRRKIQIKRKERVNDAMKYAKPIAKCGLVLGGIIVGAVVLFLVYLLFLFLTGLSAKTWHSILTFCLIGIVAVGSLWLLYLGLEYLISICPPIKINISCKWEKRINAVLDAIGEFFSVLLMPFIYIFKKIGQGIVLLVHMLQSKCPAIKWE